MSLARQTQPVHWVYLVFISLPTFKWDACVLVEEYIFQVVFEEKSLITTLRIYHHASDSLRLHLGTVGL